MRDDFRGFRGGFRKGFEPGERGGQSHVWTGVFILLIGIAALARVSYPELPRWIFSWQTFLIALGIFIGFKLRFRGGAWFILILLGSIFLIRDVYPDLAIRRYIWPAALIAVGAFMILKGVCRMAIDAGVRPGASTPFRHASMYSLRLIECSVINFT